MFCTDSQGAVIALSDRSSFALTPGQCPIACTGRISGKHRGYDHRDDRILLVRLALSLPGNGGLAHLLPRQGNGTGRPIYAAEREALSRTVRLDNGRRVLGWFG